MISITRTSYSTRGPVIFRNTENCRFGEHKARVGRHATLNAGAVIVHGGVAHGDRTFFLDVEVTEDQLSDIRYFFETDATGVMVAVSDGVYFGTISEINPRGNRLKATILIKSKESD